MSDHSSDDGCLDGCFEFASDILVTDSPWWLIVLTLFGVLAILYIHFN